MHAEYRDFHCMSWQVNLTSESQSALVPPHSFIWSRSMLGDYIIGEARQDAGFDPPHPPTMLPRVRPLRYARYARTLPRVPTRPIPVGRIAAPPTSIRTSRCLMSTEAAPSAQSAAETAPVEEGNSKPRVDLLESYRELVESGRLKWDDEQVRVVMKVSHCGGGDGG